MHLQQGIFTSPEIPQSELLSEFGHQPMIVPVNLLILLKSIVLTTD